MQVLAWRGLQRGLRCLLWVALLGVTAAHAADRPNVLVIVVDDMGFSDLGSFGGEIDTPNLDRLAYAGVRFSRFHAMPACSPTRAALLTGVDPHLAGLGSLYEELSPNQKGQPGYEGHLNERVVSIATVLRDAGYRTYLSGKWHLGNTPEQGPHSQGFDRSFALLSGGASHFADMRPAYHPDPEAKASYVEDDRLLERLPADFRYSSQFYVDRLLQYLKADEKSEQPFFAVLAYTAPHWPLQAPDATIEKYAQRYAGGYDQLYRQRRARVAELGLLPEAAEPPRPPKALPWQQLSPAERRWHARAMAVYAAMIDEIDLHSGRLLDYLASTGKLDDTLVIFLSDNGPEGHDLDETWPADVFPEIRKVIDERHDFSYENMGRPGSYTLYGAGWARAGAPGLRLYKGFPSEGGTRVAAFMHFPAGIRGGRIVSEPVSVEDLAPTILDYAGVPRHRGSYRGRAVYPMGGLSLAPMLSGAPWTPGTRGVELLGKYALREGDWKLLVMPPPYASGRAELYNIAEDPGESRNLAAEHPQKLSAMLANWRRYQTENGVILPDWVSGY